MPTGEKQMSWGAIVGLFLVFFPIGIFFLVKKISAERNSRATANIAFVFVVYGIYFVVKAFIGSSSNLTSAIIATFGFAFWLLWVAQKMHAETERYPLYNDFIYQQNVTSIDTMASMLSIPEKDAMRDLSKMIDIGELPGVFISYGTRTVVVTNRGQQAAAPASQSAGPQQAPPKVIVCGSCGANNTVGTGAVKECEYCGAPLQ